MLAYDSGASPVIVLTKADLVDDVASGRRRRSTQVSVTCPVHAVERQYR